MTLSVVVIVSSFLGVSEMTLNPELWISIIIYATMICLIQFVKVGITALHKSVVDSKDRLTIIVGVMGSLIALIALFK